MRKWEEGVFYPHGGDVYRNAVEYDFSVNINPLGMPAGSREALLRALPLCGQYPDWQGEALRCAIAQAEGVQEGQIILGNGAAELLYALCYCLRRQGHLKWGLLPEPSFSEYEAALRAAGGAPLYWNLREENAFAPERELMTAVTRETDILFFCNPNNPTGSLADRGLLLELAEKCEATDTYFCLDECFLPFLEQEEAFSLKDMLTTFPHLIILRAFTKIYGMPGLRLGYAMAGDEALLRGMRSCMQPWNTSVLAQAAGLEALKDREYLEQTRRLIRRERVWLEQELKTGLTEKLYPSCANFLFFQARPDLKELLLKEGVLIRSCSNYRNLSDRYFRIGIRTHAENEALVDRWRSRLATFSQ